MRNYPLLVVGTVLFMSACQTPEPPAPRDVTAEIQEANAQLVTAPSAGDASEAANVYEAVAITNQAVEVGQCRMFASEDGLVEKGKYMVWWKLTDGGWKIYRDTWNRAAHS